MAQSSGPISQGTDAERQFSDVLWRDLFGDEAGVVGDLDGSAYALSLAPGSDVATVGSSTQVSTARVAGFGHRIPEDSPEPIAVPPAVGAARTDILALRYDPVFTGAPGPVRLVRIAGSSVGLPVYDGAPPGIEDLPLWAVTRQPGQALSQATVTRLFTRLAPTLDVPVGAPLPLSSPLATTAQQGTSRYRRTLDSNGAPVWVPESQMVALSVPPATNFASPSSEPYGQATARLMPWGEVRLSGMIRRTLLNGATANGGAVFQFTDPLPSSIRPGGPTMLGTASTASGPCGIYYTPGNASLSFGFHTNTQVYNVSGWFISLAGLSYFL